jgi:hypothetical protein
MACPYFYPRERLSDRSKHPRLPLGDPYNGVCRVDPMHDWRPEDATLRECCNLGYAKRKCSRFPKDAPSDAIRFSVTGDEDGTLTVFFVVEQNHAPLEHGTLGYSSALGRFVEGHANQLLQQQAQAYVDSYLLRKHQPEHTARNPHRR